MKIAIVGAGLSGLALAWHLMDKGKCRVTLFDKGGVASGASGVNAALMHPYPGKEGKYSHLANEGIRATKRLLAVAQKKSVLPLTVETGLLRYPITDDVRARFLSRTTSSDEDVIPYGDAFLIRSGMTIFCRRYLEALWLALEEKGARLYKENIKGVEQLKDYDQIILAAGAGVFGFPQTHRLHIESLKGQTLTCRLPEGCALPEQSRVANGYIAHVGREQHCLIGSTYERGETNPHPDWEKAKADLFPRAAFLEPQVDRFEVVDGFAAFRVMRIGHYGPIAVPLTTGNVWVITALGSRGLLYHAFIAELLSHSILYPIDSNKLAKT